MDEVVERFVSAAISDQTEREESYFESYYKNRGKKGSQDERRKSLLENQKQYRKKGLDDRRGILQLVEEAENELFHAPRGHWRPSVYVHGYNKVSNYFNVLSGSEWLLEKPHDFAENWLMAACPKGVRVLAIAYKGKTKFFNKYGKFKFECRTALPGGNPCDSTSQRNTCVLDCFYSEAAKTMFVLDILAWNECVMTEGDAAFRHYWLESHLEAIPDLKKMTSKNKIIFKIIPKIQCTTEYLKEFVSVFPYFNENNQPAVDGLLFYHSKGQYLSGESPLIGWLYPFMLNELLGEDLNIHEAYLIEKPVGYVNFLDYIEKFEAGTARKKQRKTLGRRVEGALEDKDAAEPMSTSKEAESQLEDIAVGPLPVATNNTDTAQAQGDNQITGTGNMETEDIVQDQAQGDHTSSAQGKQGAKESKKSATMEAETSQHPTVCKIDEMESMVAEIVTEEK